jgi:hypothetical protein
MQHYLLDQYHIARPCSMVEWGDKYVTIGNKDANRVAEDTVGDYWVSTVFLGLDHSWGRGDPVLFETMVFVEGESADMKRYCTWAEAMAGHERIRSMLERELTDAGEMTTGMIAILKSQLHTTQDTAFSNPSLIFTNQNQPRNIIGEKP